MDGIRESKSETPPLDANTNEERSDESKNCADTKPRMGISEDILANISSPIVKSANYQIGRNTSNKRGRNAKDTTLRNCARKNADKGGRLKGENISSVSVRENLDPADENTVTDQLPISFDKKQGRSKLKRKKNGKVSRKINPRSKERKLDSVEINMIKEVHSIHNQMDKDEHAHDYFLPAKKPSEIKGKPGKQGEEVKSALCPEHNQDLKCKKNMEVSLDGIIEDGLVSDHQEGADNVFAEEAQSTENITGNSARATESAEKVRASLNTRILDDLATLRDHCQENGAAMLNCKLNYNIQCAFCLSSEVSEVSICFPCFCESYFAFFLYLMTFESISFLNLPPKLQASGEMIHYNNGIPVAADYNGGSRVIHSHKNCAEW